MCRTKKLKLTDTRNSTAFADAEESGVSGADDFPVFVEVLSKRPLNKL